MTDNGGRGASRKSRGRKLNVSGPLGTPLKWQPTPTDWRNLERAYGSKFDHGLREAINRAVDHYFYWEPFERVAGSAATATQTLIKARDHARSLRGLLSSQDTVAALIAPEWEFFYRDESSQEQASGGLDDDAVFDNLSDQQSSTSARDHLDFLDVVRTIEAAIDQTLRKLRDKEAGAFSEGYAWGQMIRSLAAAFGKHGLKTSVSKDSNGPLSPFVRFIQKLQDGFEPDFRRHQHSGAALSKGVSDANRDA